MEAQTKYEAGYYTRMPYPYRSLVCGHAHDTLDAAWDCLKWMRKEHPMDTSGYHNAEAGPVQRDTRIVGTGSYGRRCTEEGHHHA